MIHNAGESGVRREFRVMVEDGPGAAWRVVFGDGWPGWRSWFRGRGGGSGPDLDACGRALECHMPEFVPVWKELIAAVEGDAEVGRFLSFWCPPPYLGHCSQVVRPGPDPLLVRNYDLDPRLSEATLLHSNWSGKVVAGLVDGLCGLADGMNEDGLAVSLAYGGSREHGRGFGVPLVVRYTLETCASVPDAVATLRRLPHHMTYNLSLVDRAGRCATVFLAPGVPIVVADQLYATNHQRVVVDEEHAHFCNSRGRAQCLEELVATPQLADSQVLEAFAAAPLFNRRHREGFATVYTAAYRPSLGTVTLHWPEIEPLTHSLARPAAQHRSVHFTETAPASVRGNSEYDWLRGLPRELQQLLALYWTVGEGVDVASRNAEGPPAPW